MQENSKFSEENEKDLAPTEQKNSKTEQISAFSQPASSLKISEEIDVENESKLKHLQQQEKILTREFFTVDHLTLARNLLGKVLVRKIGDQVIKCRIVETEAYGGDDGAFKNSYHGKYSERTKPLFMEGGHLYVSLVHGLHNCMNISAAEEGELACALVRAVEILEGFDFAVKNRNMKNAVSKSGKEVANGPGKVCAALKINKSMSGYDATKPGEIYVVDQNFNNFNIVESKRINIDYAGESVHNPWRFYIQNSRFISSKGEVLKVSPFTSGVKSEEIQTIPDLPKISNECPSVSFLDKFRFSK